MNILFFATYPSFSKELQSILDEVPKQIKINSPLLHYPPVDEEAECVKQFGYIRILFSELANKPKIEKVDQTALPLLKSASYLYLLQPLYEREDPFGEESMKKGYYQIRLKGWGIKTGEGRIFNELKELFPRISLQIMMDN
ncbi:hypothetical protein [Candidatus Protochlamydia phocaeensis]|uniref:hypothetical protein n=1 Tax=Candidatus Protochlamydia phocaeensis TaxID=1414722 RepID=UPI0008391563|nr:hypothetical protein [Candidatus Protochlamydia phocaeensis]